MNTATPAPEDITTSDDIRSGALVWVQTLTTFALHASPERLTQMMRQAYGDLVPGSAARSQALDDDLAGRPRGTEPVARRPAQDQPQRWVTCGHERCSKVFERRHRLHRFCSRRCARHAARLRSLVVLRSARPGDLTAVLSEMEAALEHLRAIVSKEVPR